LITLARAGLLVALTTGAALLFLPLHSAVAPPRLSLAPTRLLADGYDTAILTIESQTKPAISVTGDATVEEIAGDPGAWTARIRAGITPGTVSLTVQPVTVQLTTVFDPADTAEDGTPDFLRLDDEHDRAAFRRWFTWLAETQYFQDPAARPPEIVDCAALIRYAYREALRAHDSVWTAAAKLPMIPALDSVAKYRYPRTPLAAALFRVRPGPFRATDIADGAFLQFADAQTLWRYNTHPVGRDLARAEPGDLLFYRQTGERTTFHSMIYLGESQVRPDGRRYLVYHTGDEMRRLTVEELLRFPEPEWRPLTGNANFLGVARWNILRGGNHHAGL
jgi:uncharacterized protein YfaT (DUF1175 family)